MPAVLLAADYPTIRDLDNGDLLYRQLHQDITEERKVLTRDVEEISLKAVDRAFYRGVQLAVVAFVVVFASAVLLLFLIRRMFSGKRVTG